MSGPKSVALSQEKTKNADSENQTSTPGAVSCEGIRERAYDKWEQAGCPCGDGVEFWLQAEAELAAKVVPTQGK